MALSEKDRLIWEQIQANQTRLDLCLQHHFPCRGLDWQEVGRAFGLKLRCQNCGGNMLATSALCYARGFAAAGGDPNAIIPGLTEPQAG